MQGANQDLDAGTDLRLLMSGTMAWCVAPAKEGG